MPRQKPRHLPTAEANFARWLLHTFAVFKVEGKVPVEKDILAIKDIGSLSVVLKSFRNLRGMLDDPIDLLFFSLIISQRTSSGFVGFIKKEYSFGLLRYLE